MLENRRNLGGGERFAELNLTQHFNIVCYSHLGKSCRKAGA